MIVLKCRQSRFYKVQTIGELPEDLSNKLNNGRGLTLFFHGIRNIIPENGMNYRARLEIYFLIEFFSCFFIFLFRYSS